MRVILYYNFFNESSKEGRDSIRVTVKNFPFEVKVKGNESKLSLKEIYDKYKDDALKAAAYSKRIEIGNAMANADVFK